MGVNGIGGGSYSPAGNFYEKNSKASAKTSAKDGQFAAKWLTDAEEERIKAKQEAKEPVEDWGKEEKIQERDGVKESKSDTEIITRPDGSRILLVKTQVGGMETMMSIALSGPAPLQDGQKETPADTAVKNADATRAQANQSET